jgi:ribosomal protein S27E
MARLVYLNGPFAGKGVELRPGVNRVGRAPDNDIQIPDTNVSSHHCELNVSDIGIAFTDLGSTNGSYLEGHQISKSVITSRKKLRLGPIEMMVELPDATVAIPERKKEEEPGANFLEDGAPACQNHATIAATQKCLRCLKMWCNDCVRATGIVGSPRRLITCVECGGGCSPIVYTPPPKKKSLFDRLGDTFRMKKPGA